MSHGANHGLGYLIVRERLASRGCRGRRSTGSGKGYARVVQLFIGPAGGAANARRGKSCRAKCAKVSRLLGGCKDIDGTCRARFIEPLSLIVHEEEQLILNRGPA